MRATLILSALLAACASPDAAFVGTFEGQIQSMGWNVDTGEPFGLPPTDVTIGIEVSRETGRAFIAGQCFVELEVESETSARLVPRRCQSINLDGSRVDAQWTGGTLWLDEPMLWLTYQVLRTLPDRTETVEFEFDGERVER